MANYTTFTSGAFTDAQKTNETTRSAKIYTDLNLYFQRNSSNQDINKVTVAIILFINFITNYSK